MQLIKTDTHKLKDKKQKENRKGPKSKPIKEIYPIIIKKILL